MFPFWHDVVAPVLEACAARRIVEVGALRGDHTALMLAHLGPDAELHVIDPVPSFDPEEHVARFAGQYVFHQDLSVNVLGGLPVMDAALLDGDHNWYTVLSELRLLAATARDHDRWMPVCILHDVGWPYGRRDLYYDPTNIPKEHRQPWDRKGIRPERKQLVPGNGGMNAGLANALVEGGPRNGVMTGIEDFIAEHDKPLRLVVLPIFYGLAILVEEERLVQQPALAVVLDRLEGPEGKDLLLELVERIRIDAVIFDHALLGHVATRADHLADRYLAALKDSLDEDGGISLEPLHTCLRAVWAEGVRGDLVACGEGSPAAPVLMAAFLEAMDTETRPTHRRRLWVTGSPGVEPELARRGLLGRPAQVAAGDLADALSAEGVGTIALAHLGALRGSRARAALDVLHPRLASGSIVMAEGATSPEVEAAVRDYRACHGISSAMETAGASVWHWRTP